MMRLFSLFILVILDYFWIWVGLTVVAFLVVMMTKNHGKLMDACMADGFKEYECVSKLRGGR